jgi:hypothetical protein
MRLTTFQLQCFHGVNRKRTVTVIMIFVTQQMAGVGGSIRIPLASR